MLPHWRELTSDYFCQEHKTFLPLFLFLYLFKEPLVRKGVEKGMRKRVETGERPANDSVSFSLHHAH